MEQKQLPKIALGAWAWGNDGTFGGALTSEELRPVFEAGMKAGLNLWDTAYAYGMGTSEKVLGKFLRDTPREDVIISDKFTPQCADPETDNAVTALYDISAENLGISDMDIYWIHNPLDAPKWTTELIPLAKSGKIGRIGLSNHNLAEIQETEAILEKEGLKIFCHPKSLQPAQSFLRNIRHSRLLQGARYDLLRLHGARARRAHRKIRHRPSISCRL